jgi:hypothetical protein
MLDRRSGNAPSWTCCEPVVLPCIRLLPVGGGAVSGQRYSGCEWKLSAKSGHKKSPRSGVLVDGIHCADTFGIGGFAVLASRYFDNAIKPPFST